jgi:hypothetical protein
LRNTISATGSFACNPTHLNRWRDYRPQALCYLAAHTGSWGNRSWGNRPTHPHQARTRRDRNIWLLSPPKESRRAHLGSLESSRRSSRSTTKPAHVLSGFLRPSQGAHITKAWDTYPFACTSNLSSFEELIEELVSHVESLIDTCDGSGAADERGTEPMPVRLFAARSSTSCFRLRSFRACSLASFFLSSSSALSQSTSHEGSTCCPVLF